MEGRMHTIGICYLCAKQFDVLPDDKKQLVKVYMSVVSAQ